MKALIASALLIIGLGLAYLWSATMRQERVQPSIHEENVVRFRPVSIDRSYEPLLRLS